jgi:hypothetical protein
VSDRHQTAAANQKTPSQVKQPAFTHLANFQFASSSTIPIKGRLTSKTNSKHNWKSTSPPGNPTLRSLVNNNQATPAFAAKTQAARKTLFIIPVQNTKNPTSIGNVGLFPVKQRLMDGAMGMWEFHQGIQIFRVAVDENESVVKAQNFRAMVFSPRSCQSTA